MKYEVHFVKAWGCCMGEPYEDKPCGVFDTIEKAQKSVIAWWTKNNFTPSFIREMKDEQGRIWWDYGPHQTFYIFSEVE